MSVQIRIQKEDFNVSSECDALTNARNNIGAVATFTGLVRDDDGLTAMTLEHYPGMTEREIANHVAQAESRWPLSGTIIIHRIGRLLPGERIVLVAVAASHRGTAFEACQFLMDYLKTRAPFWKQEERGASTQWVEAKSVDDKSAERWRKE